MSLYIHSVQLSLPATMHLSFLLSVQLERHSLQMPLLMHVLQPSWQGKHSKRFLSA